MHFSDVEKKQQTKKSIRPWGDLHIIVRNQPCSVDVTHVKPGERSSLHAHQKRAELFHFLDDGATLEINGQIYRPGAHEEYVLMPGDRHRFWATDRDFRMVVISFGEWDVADQVRHEDDYGRAGEPLQL
jgi:mannose-6-phosphate isomerase-like protein (cupin superfamily)